MLKLALSLILCSILTNAQSNPSCMVGWTYFPKSNKCFKMFGGKFDGLAPTNFDTAKSYCMRFNGGHLASFHSDDEITFLVELAHEAIVNDDGQGAPVFIGLSYAGNIDWEWHDGTALTFTKWFYSSDAVDDGIARARSAGTLCTKRAWTGTVYLESIARIYPFACQTPPISPGG